MLKRITSLIILGLVVLLSHVSCSGSSPTNKEKKHTSEVDSTIETSEDSLVKEKQIFPDGIELYNLLVREEGTDENKTLTCFISLSETVQPYADIETDDFFPLTNSEDDTLERIPIEGKYRSSLLKAANITEKDNVYLYNYDKNKLLVIPVSKLKSVALINSYATKDDAPFDEFAYHIAFEFNPSILDKLSSYYGSQTIAYIGQESPFVQGGMKAITWKKRKSNEWPGKQGSAYLKKFKSLKMNDPLSYKMDSLTYWVRDWGTNEYYRDKRELVVVNSTGKILYEKLMESDEGCRMSGLNSKNSDYEQREQFAGQLIKGAGPTFIGFESFSFSCESFRFVQFPKNKIVLKCDSRH